MADTDGALLLLCKSKRCQEGEEGGEEECIWRRRGAGQRPDRRKQRGNEKKRVAGKKERVNDNDLKNGGGYAPGSLHSVASRRTSRRWTPGILLRLQMTRFGFTWSLINNEMIEESITSRSNIYFDTTFSCLSR